MISGLANADRSRIFLTFAAFLFIAACARAPELIGIDNPDVPVASVEEAKVRKVFITSTREATEATGALYSEVRAPELGLASVQVSIPPSHVVGNLERPKRLPPDPRTEFAIVDPTIYASDSAFLNSLNRELSKLPPGERDVLFFIHGYNNTTSDAILRLAQFAEDSGFNGVPVLFDWASAASLTRYVYDMNSALIARQKVYEISQLLLRANIDSVDIFAHSMGSFLTMEAMKDAALANRLNPNSKIQTITLASPDIDMDLFRTQLQTINTNFDQFYVLLSSDDSALRVSRRIAGGVPRVGASNIDELAKLGVIAIDLSEIEDSRSGSHTKFAGSPEVVQLIGNGLNSAGDFSRHERAARLPEVLGNIPITIAFE